ncbi:MAG: ADP-ribosylglycohydrolase family protein [Abitibacteriaceae bacterium]|nr:ADP-ribosylglycohydrolase family protein [Abditibacteriaceae bacterium]
MPTRQERIEGAIIGLLVGDALGVPYEFHPPEELPPLEQIEFDPPVGFHRAHQGVPPGTWSDDGAQALCLLASLLACGQFDAEDFGQRMLRWYEEGYYAVGNIVFDVGITTAKALRAIRAGTPALQAGPTGDYDNGNGSLMRVLPLALWHQGSDAELVRDAQLQSRVTHGHLRSQVCCALYCLWARRIMEEASDPWIAAVSTLREIYTHDEAATTELEWSIRPDDEPHGTGSGYVVDCLRSARLVMNAGSYEQVVKAAIALGHDTDTTACVAGGIAGLRDGIEAIPQRWRTRLRGMELVEGLIQQL